MIWGAFAPSPYHGHNARSPPTLSVCLGECRKGPKTPEISVNSLSKCTENGFSKFFGVGGGGPNLAVTGLFQGWVVVFSVLPMGGLAQSMRVQVAKVYLIAGLVSGAYAKTWNGDTPPAAVEATNTDKKGPEMECQS